MQKISYLHRFVFLRFSVLLTIFIFLLPIIYLNLHQFGQVRSEFIHECERKSSLETEVKNLRYYSLQLNSSFVGLRSLCDNLRSADINAFCTRLRNHFFSEIILSRLSPSGQENFLWKKTRLKCYGDRGGFFDMLNNLNDCSIYLRNNVIINKLHFSINNSYYCEFIWIDLGRVDN